uniref:KIND domain-containing protein n=1 Tax=Hippocampus comes TaxID=109280 RepID=A0A3Q2XRR7_HIPCM
MGTFVTLAEVLEARGSPLDEDEVWCLLLVTTEALLDLSLTVSGVVCSGSGNMCSVLSPGSVLLSANGRMAFKSCGRNDDVASFVAPEVIQGHTTLVYSLGMTFYWCVDYQVPQNQPIYLSAALEGLLLSMCEDTVVRRTNLMTVLETCELHHKTFMLHPAERLVKQLVEDIYRNSVRGPQIGTNRPTTSTTSNFEETSWTTDCPAMRRLLCTSERWPCRRSMGTACLRFGETLV